MKTTLSKLGAVSKGMLDENSHTHYLTSTNHSEMGEGDFLLPGTDTSPGIRVRFVRAELEIVQQ